MAPKHLAALLNWQQEGTVVQIQGSFLRLLALPLIYWVPGQTTASVYGSSLACKPQIITDNYSTFILSCVVLDHHETPAGRWLAPTVRWPHQKQLVQVVLNLNSSNSSDVSYPRKHKPSPELRRGGKQLEMRGKYNGETFLIQSSTSQNPSRCGSSLMQML